MTKRSMTGIIFAVIIFVEVVAYLMQPTPTSIINTGERSGFFSGHKTVVDYEKKNSTNTTFVIIIGATVLVGAIVTFSQPNDKLKTKPNKLTEKMNFDVKK